LPKPKKKVNEINKGTRRKMLRKPLRFYRQKVYFEKKLRNK
jgi:hypothetical protein